jgi:hypothetical protein
LKVSVSWLAKFPASDPVSIVQPVPRAGDFDRVTTSTMRCVDEREAFWAAIYKFRSPAFPDEPTFEVKGKHLTIRQVCEFVKDITAIPSRRGVG